MNSFVLTVKAKADLKAIASYTQQRWGKKQRNFYIKQMDDAFHLLAASPLTGKAVDDIKAGYRKFPQGSHVIFYRMISNDTMEVVRILHKTMDVERKL